MAGKTGYDSHNHPLYFGIFSEALDLTGLEKEEALTRIKAEGHHLVTNWDNSKWSLTSQELKVDFTVIVFNASFHGMVMNEVARKNYGLRSDPSGLINNPEQVAQVVMKLVGGFSKEQFKRFLLKTQKEYLQLGLYGVDDMGIRAPNITPFQAVKELKDEGRLELEMNLFLRLPFLQRVIDEAPDLLEFCAGLKVVADGAFGVWTAAVSKPYRDQPGNYGRLYLSPEELKAQIICALKLGVPTIAAHCIGDSGIQTVLEVYEKVAKQEWNTTGWRLEHAILINAQQARLAKQLGLVLSMQPNFSSDVRYVDRLGDRIHLVNPFRMLIDEIGFVPGQDLIFGSDGMPTGLEEGLKWATNPQFDSQRLTIEEAQKGYRVR